MKGPFAGLITDMVNYNPSHFFNNVDTAHSISNVFSVSMFGLFNTDQPIYLYTLENAYLQHCQHCGPEFFEYMSIKDTDSPPQDLITLFMPRTGDLGRFAEFFVECINFTNITLNSSQNPIQTVAYVRLHADSGYYIKVFF